MKSGKVFVFWWLLQKRLLKKPMFLILLFLIPALCFGYSVTAEGEGGVLTVALAQTGADPLAAAVIADLDGSSQLIRFQVCDDRESAEEMVRRGAADAAWIFPEGMQEKITRFATDPRLANAFVEVVERESNVLMLLSREKLSGTLYGLCARQLYLHFLRQNIPAAANATDDQLLRYFNLTDTPEDLFIFTQADGAAIPEADLLTSPVRGLLGVIVVVCGIGAAMYHCRDLERGTFAWVPVHQQYLAELGCVLTATLDLALVSFLSLVLSGLAGSVLPELLSAVLFGLCAAIFAMGLRRLVGSVKVLGVLLPLLITAMLVLCPIFFSLPLTWIAQHFFPPTCYILAAYQTSYLGYMLAYTAAGAIVYFLLGLIFKRK